MIRRVGRTGLTLRIYGVVMMTALLTLIVLPALYLMVARRWPTSLASEEAAMTAH